MYTSILRAVALTLPLSFTAEAVFAQAETALEAAQRRAVCGSGVPVSATYLANGSLQVTCRTSTTGLPETGLSTETAAGVLAGTVFLVLVTDDDDDTTTTTTTTTTGGS
ncbi:hypothetical protein [Leisingera sp. JC11]|uniref:hypothetical protein n=1 Tax=Leisingera sp. JC11 TaxID=3042469 RepID=UPI0034566C7B